MYQPKRYEKNGHAFAEKLIRENPFAEFILQGKRLLATHIPILIDEDKSNLVLFGHIANHNPQKAYLRNGAEALLIFRGPHAYVSSSWYEEKDISTWDYSAVHINCRLKIQNTDDLVNSLKRLVHHFEKDQDKPLEYENIPIGILNANLPHITGFWCEPTRIEGIGKWHQGFGEKDILNVVEHLKSQACPHANGLITNIKEEHGLRD